MVALHANEKILEGVGQARKTKDVMIGLEPESLEGWGLETDSNPVTNDSPSHVCVTKQQ